MAWKKDWYKKFLINSDNDGEVYDMLKRYFPRTCLKFELFDDEDNLIEAETYSEEAIKDMAKRNIIKIIETENGRIIKGNPKGWIEELEELGEYKVLEELKRREGIN